MIFDDAKNTLKPTIKKLKPTIKKTLSCFAKRMSQANWVNLYLECSQASKPVFKTDLPWSLGLPMKISQESLLLCWAPLIEVACM
jgi:hypothetical protein